MNATFEKELAWTRRHLPRLQRALAALPDLAGMRLACSMHLDSKIVPLVEGLLERRAGVFLTTCNPATVRDEVVAHLRRLGSETHASKDMPEDAYQQSVHSALAWEPTHLCELGAGLSLALSAGAGNVAPVRAGLEGTSSGISLLEQIRPPYPVFNWNDLPVKEGLHNRHMVGLTTWQTFFARTQLSLHEKQVAVMGYGSVGQGLAATAPAFGGAVVVVERDPVRSIQAQYDGWRVLPLKRALPGADVVVTATGARQVLSVEHWQFLKDGAFLLNVGHHADEIDVAGLRSHPHREVLPYIEEVDLGGRTVFLIAGGSMANLAAGSGDSLNAFDLILAILAAGIGHIAGEGEKAAAGAHLLPRKVWEPTILD